MAAVPLCQYAREVIDPRFGTSFTSFMNVYLKQKYAKQPLTQNEQQLAAGFLNPFLKNRKAKDRIQAQVLWIYEFYKERRLFCTARR